MYSTIDLFAGAGGLSLGFEQTGKFDIKVAFENNPAMQRTYSKNHPAVDVRGDVYAANYDEIKETHGSIDVVIGGPPCQGFSNANRQKNQAVSRNNALVKEYIRAVLELRPKAFVMENVSMLRSDVHRFYLSEQDVNFVENSSIKTKNTPIVLLEQQYVFDGVEDIVKNRETINSYLWTSDDYFELNVIYKACKGDYEKRKKALEKHQRTLTKIAEKHLEGIGNTPIKRADERAFSAVLNYYKTRAFVHRIKDDIEAAIMYQRMLSHALEIIDNKLVVDSLSHEGDFRANIRSFAVYDYIMEKLGSGNGINGYSINSGVLCAADFGAPQKRMRFVVIGIRKDIADEITMPLGSFKEESYRTVHDAIADLEMVEPITDISKDSGIPLDPLPNLGELAERLRDSNILMNHVVTATTSVAMDRFKALQQGQNFHALDESMKKNTYSDASRTQNTIYLRLDYNKPSGTVVNVRKSMWIHPINDRAISIREAARLQTFPDSFIFCGSKDQQYQQVGNAVPPIMAKSIAKKLAKQLKKNEKEQN